MIDAETPIRKLQKTSSEDIVGSVGSMVFKTGTPNMDFLGLKNKSSSPDSRFFLHFNFWIFREYDNLFF